MKERDKLRHFCKFCFVYSKNDLTMQYLIWVFTLRIIVLDVIKIYYSIAAD